MDTNDRIRVATGIIYFISVSMYMLDRVGIDATPRLSIMVAIRRNTFERVVHGLISLLVYPLETSNCIWTNVSLRRGPRSLISTALP